MAGRDQGQIRVPLGGVQDLQEALPWHGVQAPYAGPRQNLGRDKTRLVVMSAIRPPNDPGLSRNHLAVTPYILHARTFQRSRNEATRAYSVSDEEGALVRADVW